MRDPRRSTSLRPLLATVLLAALAAAGCGGNDDAERLRAENEELKRQLAESAAPTGAVAPKPTAAPAAADDWAWADSAPAAQPATAAPPAPERPAPQPIEREQPKPKPVAKPPAPAPAPDPAPTNRLETAAPEPLTPPAPATITRTAAAGTSFDATLASEISASTSQVGDAVTATLGADLLDSTGAVVLPAGTQLTGRVTEVKAPGKAKKKAIIAFRFEQATLADGSTVAISAGRRLEGEGYTKKEGAIIGGSAAGGALLGQVLGKDTESTVGGAILGGAIATGVVMSKRGEDVVIPAGTVIGLELETPVSAVRPAS